MQHSDNGEDERVIYGVDIQERAIEICKLRLWLSLMVDFDPGVNIENCSAKAFGDALKKIPALPNLDFKICRANSLVDMVRGHPLNLKHGGPDQKGMLPPILNKLVTAKRQFYDAHKIADKRRLRFDILDATAELAMYEFSATKTDIVRFVLASGMRPVLRGRTRSRPTSTCGASWSAW